MAFSSPAAMAQAQRAAEAQSMKALQDRREQTRKDFFKGRQDVSNNRLDRRQIQKDLYEAFKNDPTKTREVAKNLYQAAQPGGKTLAQYNQDLARKYGPTLSEIGGDIRYGLGSLAKAFAEKGPPILQMIKGLGSKVKSGVEAAWDAVRGEPTSVQGTAFPQPGSDTKDYFSSIDTGIAQVDPTNMLVQIAMENADKDYSDNRSFEEKLANATAMNLNVPSPTEAAQTISDYYTAAAQGVNLNTPIGDVNVNPLAQKLFLDGGIGNVEYGGYFDPNTLDYNVGIGTKLPYNVNFSAGASSNDIPGMSFSKYIGPVNTSLNLSEQGGSLGLNTVVDPLRAIFPGSSIGTPINIGASVDSRGNINPNVGFMFPFNSGGLGYMFK